jgi:hypothetical protein
VKAKARSSIRTHKTQERGSDCKFGCRAIALHSSKKGFGLLREHSEMGLLVGFKLRLARSNCFG